MRKSLIQMGIRETVREESRELGPACALSAAIERAHYGVKPGLCKPGGSL